MAKTQGKLMKHKRTQTQHDVKNDDAMQHLLQQLMQKVDSLHAKVDTLSNKLGITFQEPVQTQAKLFMGEVQDRDDLVSVSGLSQHSAESDNSGHVIVTMPGESKDNSQSPNNATLSNTLDSTLRKAVHTQKIWKFLDLNRKVGDQRDLDLASQCSGHTTDSEDSGYVHVAFPAGHFEPQGEGNRTRGMTTTNSEITARQLTPNSPERVNAAQKKQRTTDVRKEESALSDSRPGTGKAVGHIDSQDVDIADSNMGLRATIDRPNKKNDTTFKEALNQAWTLRNFERKVRYQRDSDRTSEFGRYTTKSGVSECGNFEPQKKGHKSRRLPQDVLRQFRPNRFSEFMTRLHSGREISEGSDFRQIFKNPYSTITGRRRDCWL